MANASRLQDLLAPSARWTPRLKFGALREKNQVRRKRYCFFPSDRKFARPASGTPQGGGRRSAPYKPHCVCVLSKMQSPVQSPWRLAAPLQWHHSPWRLRAPSQRHRKSCVD